MSQEAGRARPGGMGRDSRRGVYRMELTYQGLP
jgi:hypothetical protein